MKIFASGDLDEHKVENLARKGAKIDAFGVETRMSTSNYRLTHAPTYVIELSPHLKRIQKELTRRLKKAKT
jgi:nicotinic acid phosphoribosyltransferase